MNKKHLRGSTQATILPLAIILTADLWSDSLGEYCGHHTASSVFLVLIPHIVQHVLHIFSIFINTID